MIAEAVRKELRRALGAAIRFDVATRKLTSLRVGGAADAVATPADRAALARLLEICAQHGIPQRTLGRGFNTIVRDGGVDGVLIQLSKFRQLERAAEDALFVEAGVTHATLTRHCRAHGLSGLEFGAGIPGSIGGWVAMNAGIPGREMQDVVREIEVMSPTGRQQYVLPRAALDFRYRGLHGLAPGAIVLSAKLSVAPATKAVVAAEIKRQLARRAAEQPLNRPSCGSVFRNPPHNFAGRLIEAAGLKGERHGGARISEQHANFIINEGDASAADVLALIGAARAAVERCSGIRLATEVKVWGRTP